MRSRKTKLTPTRIDLLFQDVRAIEVRAWFDGIRIEEVDKQFLKGRGSNPIEMIEPGNKVYSLSSSGWNGFIVGGVFSFTEDDGEFFAPSSLLANS